MADSVTSKPVRNVVVPIDGSSASERAFRWYADNMARPTSDVITLVHVMESNSVPAGTYGVTTPSLADEYERVMHENEHRAELLRDKFFEMAKSDGMEHVTFKQLYGRPGEAIVRCVRDSHVDVIVMGSRGLGKLRRTILGSVSDYVLHHAHVTVVISPKVKSGSRHPSESD